MTGLARVLVALAVALAQFWAVAWLAAAPTGPDPAFQTLGILVVAVLALAPILGRRPFAPIAVPVLAAYVATRILLAEEALAASVLTLESLALAALAWLVHHLFSIARRLEEPDGALAQAPSGSVLQFEEVQIDPGQRQFLLAGRHERPLSCVVVEVDESSLKAQLQEVAREADRAFLRSCALSRAAKVAADTARRSDLAIAGDDPHNLVLLCPETSAASAVCVAKKIARALASELGLEVKLGVATFPEQALSLRELVRRAESSLEHPSCLGDTAQRVLPFLESEEAAPSHRSAQAEPEASRPSRSSGVAGSLASWDAGVLWKPAPRERAGWLAKRAFDLFVVCLSAPLWAPVFALIAIAVKVDSPGGPVLFKQIRVGRFGRRFRMLKFRTMVPAAEELKKELRSQSEMQWPDFKMKKDPRITRVGRFLRQTSLDELPQLLNVLLGDMSLVGPRPTSFSDETYTLWQKARLTVQPGLTGLWQINGRGSSDFEQRARIDIAYIERRSLLLDLRILFRTAGVVLGRKGGY